MAANRKRITALLGATAMTVALGVASGLVLATPGVAQAQTQAMREFNIPAQNLGSALEAFSRQSGLQIAVDESQVAGRRSTTVNGRMTPDAALRRLLAGQGLAHRISGEGVVVIRRETDVVATNNGAAPPMVATPVQILTPATTLSDVIVTARRREERIIDVPISVSAFSEEQLEDLKIEGGSELLRAIPNVTFSKDNFTGYNFSIRGIGTKALSSTVDPGVAVSFNNTALLRNRLFEQEYFDIQRLEVLRGPQGTLYGRNSTAGVVNMLPNLPRLGQFSGEMQGELGNFDTQRVRGFVNVPLGDTLAVRFAGAMTKREGFDHNTVTETAVNGRDLWAGRLGVLWQPTSSFRANFLWEHFEEDDDRARTGKQMCTRGVTPTEFDYRTNNGQAAVAPVWTLWTRSALTPGCQAKSLFTNEAFGVADSFGSPMVTGLLFVEPYSGSGDNFLVDEYIDPFNTGDGTQSRDLRQIATHYDPRFQAKNDVFQLNLELDLGESLTLYSQTLYMEDSYFGSQDFLRSQPRSGIFRPSAGKTITPFYDMTRNPNGYEHRFGFGGMPDTAFGAVFCDPQLGCADHAQAVDISRSESTQFSQEFRLTSAFDGPFNFHLGANYLQFETQEDYYVFSNLFTLLAMRQNLASGRLGNWQTAEYGECGSNDPTVADANCVYIDPNPIGSINGEGHNYLRNLSLSETRSWAVFGEGYWALTDNLNLTLGLRYTNDEKTVTPVPTQLLLAQETDDPTSVGRGFHHEPAQTQDCGELTGRASIDWRPVLSFTDETLVYASYARGYKGGGGNPAGQAFDPNEFPPLPASFAPEYVNAFEFGAKNSFFGGKAMLSATGFFYDYTDYQVTQLMDRAFHTETFDTAAYGLEFEGAWRPTRALRIDATLGLLRTTVAQGEQSIDVMNRTADNDDWMVVRPWATSPFTCIVPADIMGAYIGYVDGPLNPNPSVSQIRGNWLSRQLCPMGNRNPFGPGSTAPFVWDPVNDARGGGRGFHTDLGGNSLPNSPEMTFNIGAQYTMELTGGWNVTWRGDYYRQSESFARIYNSEYDRLQSWDNANLSATVTRDGSPVTAQVYVKNVFDKTPITDAFTGPDELGNFANVFTLAPRIMGVSVRTSF